MNVSGTVVVDGIPIAGITNGIGVVGVIVIVGWMLFTGRLVTRREHADAIHDRDEWRAESRIKDTQLAEKDKQLTHLEQVGFAVNAVMRAVQKGSSSDHEVPG